MATITCLAYFKHIKHKHMQYTCFFFKETYFVSLTYAVYLACSSFFHHRSWSFWVWSLWSLAQLWHPPPESGQTKYFKALTWYTSMIPAAVSGDFTYMVPVLLGAMRQLLPSFHQQNAGIADVSNTIFWQSITVHQNTQSITIRLWTLNILTPWKEK